MSDSVMDGDSIAQVAAAKLPIGLGSIEEIIREEDSSEFYFKAHFQHPEWPGGASGVTILLGYDLGYATHAKVDADLKGKIPDAMLAACQSVVGIRGGAAHDAMLRVRSQIDLPWSVALDVFLRNDMPQCIATVRKVLPNTELLPPDCLERAAVFYGLRALGPAGHGPVPVHQEYPGRPADQAVQQR